MAKRTKPMTQSSDNVNMSSERTHFEELERIAEKSTSSEYTYYFEDRETNPLKNVITSRILINDYTIYHKHDFYEVNIVLEGVLYQHMGARNFVLRPGELIFMTPGVYHNCYCDEGSRCYNLLFKADWLKKVASGFEKYDPSNYLTSLAGSNGVYTIISSGKSTDILDVASQTIEHSRKLVHHSDLFENLTFENCAANFLLTLSKFPRQEYTFTGKSRTSNDATPEDIVRYIMDNFNKINLPDTAARFGYSKSQLHRILEKNTGTSFTEIVLSMRMQRARHYLLNTVLPIKNIAYLLGLDSAEHFTRMFKKNRGMTPKQYRDLYMRLELREQLSRKKR